MSAKGAHCLRMFHGLAVDHNPVEYQSYFCKNNVHDGQYECKHNDSEPIRTVCLKSHIILAIKFSFITVYCSFSWKSNVSESGIHHLNRKEDDRYT